MGIEDLTRPPEHEKNAATFLAELEIISGRWPELSLLGINEAILHKELAKTI